MPKQKVKTIMRCRRNAFKVKLLICGAGVRGIPNVKLTVATYFIEVYLCQICSV